MAVLRSKQSWDDESEGDGQVSQARTIATPTGPEDMAAAVDLLGEVIHDVSQAGVAHLHVGDHSNERSTEHNSEHSSEQTGEHYPDSPVDRPGWHVRLFGSHEFFRLWIVQVVSATGDWLGFSAIILLAADLGGNDGPGAGAGAISLVMAARIVPGFFFGPMAGVLVDRWDRKKVMIACDLGRAAVVVCLPFVRNLVGLVVASLVLEVLTLLWSPAKEASVPNLVPPDHLTTANSLSLAAAYGTFPFASLLFALLAGASAWLASTAAVPFLSVNQMALAFYVDGATFVLAALLIRTLPIGRRRVPQTIHESKPSMRVRSAHVMQELREGWHYIFLNHTVRAVNIGLATGLIGGGMLIPLGAVFSTEVLGAGAAGYGIFTTALGFGVAIGAVGVSAFQKRLPQAKVFIGSLLLAGVFLFAAACSSNLAAATLFVGLMGVTVGPVYVMGFVLLQQEVNDDLRGRVFSSLNTLVRFCVLVSMVAGPLLSAVLGGLSMKWLGGTISLAGAEIAVPGVRLALWLAALIIVAAGLLALLSLRSGQRSDASVAGTHPSRRVKT
ncbi:MAG: MFS transporter [Actinomycetes bacterium]